MSVFAYFGFLVAVINSIIRLSYETMPLLLRLVLHESVHTSLDAAVNEVPFLSYFWLSFIPEMIVI